MAQIVGRSYPFLDIAKLFDVPYSVVLEAADDLRKVGKILDSRNLPTYLKVEIIEAHDQQERIRRGIDPFQ